MTKPNKAQIKEALYYVRRHVRVLQQSIKYSPQKAGIRTRTLLPQQYKLDCPHPEWEDKEETTRACHFHLWECTLCGLQVLKGSSFN